MFTDPRIPTSSPDDRRDNDNTDRDADNRRRNRDRRRRRDRTDDRRDNDTNDPANGSPDKTRDVYFDHAYCRVENGTRLLFRFWFENRKPALVKTRIDVRRPVDTIPDFLMAGG